jgi:hypothetical protein
MQRALNAIEMQGHSDEEDGPPEQHQDDPPAPIPLDQAPAEDNVDNLMNILAAAYNGYPSDSTISLLLHLNSVTAVALADTGSTNTFMDYHFAKKHNIPLTKTKQRTVKVAGGGTLSSDYMAYQCSFAIQGHKFTVDFIILELQGSDVILGVNWFKMYNPVTFDFINRSLTLGINGTLHTFQDHIFPRDKFIISSDHCSKLIEKGALGYMLFSAADLPDSQPIETTALASDELTNILHQFQDIF